MEEETEKLFMEYHISGKEQQIISLRLSPGSGFYCNSADILSQTGNIVIEKVTRGFFKKEASPLSVQVSNPGPKDLILNLSGAGGKIIPIEYKVLPDLLIDTQYVLAQDASIHFSNDDIKKLDACKAELLGDSFKIMKLRDEEDSGNKFVFLQGKNPGYILKKELQENESISTRVANLIALSSSIEIRKKAKIPLKQGIVLRGPGLVLLASNPPIKIPIEPREKFAFWNYFWLCILSFVININFNPMPEEDN